ncbi:uncharacterized protein NECHADRAFT_89129 [Fusarium vanettenii 77-13-4]|uniref:F-box domain-containing protein n=1 Tax=Fusarium vanettenii (strain ATCC MYA-4622 / CBS 123669 / FGSC 9596 / NRRL 45880 / 77-13-4) TaxID=660122 RepID=C7ZQB2_FUSV7|nr:uncharacterized protein NECHADRAFT_89129 [Fusarium vanettenii 77-13-4]EEU33790.1 hypothetical protein NECHADRAFT_89129 [Fusarium vanettenii 77-13-4]
MALFVDCPQEIVDSILQWLSPKDIRALCLVDKSRCTAAQPRLYFRIEWEWAAKVPPVDLLLRTLLEKPALGECVQSVILKGVDIPGQYCCPATPAKPQFDDGGVDDLVAFVKSRELPRRYTNHWIKGLRSSRSTLKMDAYIACLLAMLPNLGFLKLEPGFAVRSKLSSRMFRAALSVFPRQHRPKLPHFEQLRDVAHLRRIASIPFGRSKGADLLTPFLYLPKVHQVSACIDNTPYWRWPERKPALETLTTLNLAFIHAKHLGTILSETKNLQALRWDWRGWPYTQSTDGHWISLDEIMAALQHVQETLIELKVLGSCNYLSYHRRTVRLTGSLQGMVSFKKLKTLEIPLAFLAGLAAPDQPTQIGESLPVTVEHVALTDDFCKTNDWQGQQQLEVFSLWMDNLKNTTSRLQRFVWVTLLRDTVVEWHSKSVLTTRLLDACGRAGVEFEIDPRYGNFERKHYLGWD